MIMDLQLIDVETCEPVKTQYVEFWQANQTVSTAQFSDLLMLVVTFCDRAYIAAQSATAMETPMTLPI